MAVEFQQHSFYDLIINKARGKSGPVSLISHPLNYPLSSQQDKISIYIIWTI
jgi:hypothetical protein